MTQYQLLPYQRTAEVLNERAGLGTSPGTLQRAVRVAATRPEAPVNAIRRALIAAPVAHADETGRRVNGNLYRLHVLSTDRFTACFPHPQRGAEERYSCWQAFCNAHHLRELTAIAERSPSQPWATDMIALLCQANALVSEAQGQDLKALPTSDVERLRTRYDTILTEAPERRHFSRNPKWGPSDVGCKKLGDGHGLRRPAFVLRPSRRALRSSLTLPCFPVLLRSRQSSPSPPSWHPRADQTIPGLQPYSAAARALQRGPALPYQPARSLRQQPGRTRPANAQTQAESLRLFPLTRRKQSDDIFNSLVLTFQGQPPMLQLE